MSYRPRLTTYGRTMLFAIAVVLGACCVFIAKCHGQAPSPNAVTGHMAGVSGTPVAGTYINFQLAGCAGGSPRILGYTGIAPLSGNFLPNSAGLISGTIWPNDLINCGGTTGNSRWQVTYVVNNVPTGPSTCYQVLSTVNPFNLDVAVPATPCYSATPILPNDVTYHNLTLTGFLSGVNALFGGTVQANTFQLNAAPTPCPSGQYMTGLSATLGVICTAASVPVTSVFGRTGAVTAATGDYSCAQITGAICSAATLYYQTVQQDTYTLAQESKLRLLSGSNATVRCVDNPGNGSTDCTVAVVSTAIFGTLTWSGGTVTGPSCGGSLLGTLSATPPAGSAVVMSLAPGSTISQPGIEVLITGIVGANVTAEVCTFYTGSFSDGPRTYNLKVVQ